ncbi:unnamed protein product, partial [Vitis vinifera]|uniref:Uncharacterized protein n=1 Tax=Vitis vinifera TaxID=29760 RepID=D7T280_VITVI
MYSVRTYFLLWNSKSQVIWIQDNQEQKFPIDGINKIRFQVQSVSYSPVPVEQRKESKPFAPMVISVSSSFELHPFKVGVFEYLTVISLLFNEIALMMTSYAHEILIPYIWFL